MDWFPKPKPRGHGRVSGTLLRMAIGGAAAAVLYKLGHVNLAIAAGAIAVVVGGISLASPRAADAISRALAWFGRAVGTAVGSVLLTLAYLLVLTPARFVKRLAGDDDLRLRDERLPSYYEPCDAPERKIRHARTMFATEVLRPRRGGIMVWLVTFAVLLGLAELILRAEGFGPGAVLYVPDVHAGYYPGPHQNLDRYGGRVVTNRFGMRAPEAEERKPAGKFRILMLGDSTLWGGSYIDQDQLYARILDRKLDEIAGGDDVEVLNMGVNGWGPFHERGFIDKFGALDADLVLVCLPHDDVDREKYSLMSVPYFTVGHPPALALEEVVMHSTWRYRRDKIAFKTFKELRAEQRELGIREYERLGAYLQDGTGDAEPSGPKPRTPVGGSEVFFEILPSRSVGALGKVIEPLEPEVVGKLKERLATHKIEVHYPAGLFVGKGPLDDLYHDEVHLHFLGHALYADFLVEQVTKSSTRFAAWLKSRPARKAQ
ncbi:MAG: hypothetical protein R3F14_43560 [Polyangiaceae bacterium]